MLNNISALLDKFRNINNESLIVRTITREILERDFLIKIPEDKIKFKSSVVRIGVSGSAKAEIATQKDKILKKINDVAGREVVSDIK